MPRRPRIGLTMDYVGDGKRQYMLPYDYATSVERAGGLPLPIPFLLDRAVIPDLLDTLDGVVLIGGEDLDPSRWGETRHPKAEPLDEGREAFDFALLTGIERRRTPLLGVCLGCQQMNVHRGGTLTQFLPERPGALEHRNQPRGVRHDVTIVPDSVLADVIGTDELSVNTRHKQGLANLGKSLRIVATAPDGVIEGIEDASFPLFLGVQWHPENLHAEREHLGLFRRLVDVASRTAGA